MGASILVHTVSLEAMSARVGELLVLMESLPAILLPWVASMKKN